MNVLLNKAYLAGATLNPYRLVKFGADDDHVIQTAAVGDAIFGVIDIPGSAAAAEDRVDVMTHGIADVILGGTVTRGGLITTDATGQGVAAAPAAGVNNSVIGRAMISGVVGDIIPVLIATGQVQG